MGSMAVSGDAVLSASFCRGRLIAVNETRLALLEVLPMLMLEAVAEKQYYFHLSGQLFTYEIVDALPANLASVQRVPMAFLCQSLVAICTAISAA